MTFETLEDGSIRGTLDTGYVLHLREPLGKDLRTISAAVEANGAGVVDATLAALRILQIPVKGQAPIEEAFDNMPAKTAKAAMQALENFEFFRSGQP